MISPKLPDSGSFWYTGGMAEEYPRVDGPELIDVDEDRLMAALSYMWFLVFVPLVLRSHNKFVRFHAKQGLVLFGLIIVSWLAAAWISVVGSVLFLILMIIDLVALVQALLGKRWKIPVIGQLADRFNV